MTDSDDLAAARSSACARLREVMASPKPSYSIDGQSVSWNEYTKMLTEQIKAIDEILSGGEEPFFEITQVFT